MKRIYEYRGVQITVELEPVPTFKDGAVLPVSERFLAIVQVKTASAGVPLFAPLRLADDRSNYFSSQAEALMAGYSAGQRLVDDTAAA
ncbi:hypothetical protein [Paraburkholderia caffeinilytica]|uniref:hypothetical protein n=1 Tax=Paraburkholderia caffeinilytica TaxID=1761016 RepID=UPI0038BDD4C7